MYIMYVYIQGVPKPPHFLLKADFLEHCKKKS